jgi:RNA polymerase sigma-70 factor (ECF subfamily)
MEGAVMLDLETLDLVRLARAGDQNAFGELVVKYQSMVFATAFRRLRNRTTAAEVTQDVFIQMLRKLPQLRDDNLLEAWLRKIAVRLSINRAVRRPRERLGEEIALDSAMAQSTAPLDRMMARENADQLREGLERLRALDRETLIAFYFEGRSLQEMSDQFASPIGTIKRRLHTARIRLRETLSELQLGG